MSKPLSLREILKANVARLMQAQPELGTQQALRKRSGLGGGSFEGLVKGNKAPTVDTIEKVAEAFGVSPWQLLVPDLDPQNPPTIAQTAVERELYARLRQDIRVLQERLDAYQVRSSK